MIAKRLGLDIVFDELLVTLPGIDVRPAMAGRRAAEKSKPHHRLLRCAANLPDYAGLNIGTGGPFSVSLNTTLTGWPTRSASKSQSTMLVIMVGPSASVT